MKAGAGHNLIWARSRSADSGPQAPTRDGGTPADLVWGKRHGAEIGGRGDRPPNPELGPCRNPRLGRLQGEAEGVWTPAGDDPVQSRIHQHKSTEARGFGIPTAGPPQKKSSITRKSPDAPFVLCHSDLHLQKEGPVAIPQMTARKGPTRRRADGQRHRSLGQRAREHQPFDAAQCSARPCRRRRPRPPPCARPEVVLGRIEPHGRVPGLTIITLRPLVAVKAWLGTSPPVSR